MYPLEERELLGIVHDHELLEQPLDDLADRGTAADVQLLDGVERQVEGSALVRGGRRVHEFIILACDGIWDVMSNEELCEFVKSRLEVSDDLEYVCNWVVDTCL